MKSKKRNNLEYKVKVKKNSNLKNNLKKFWNYLWYGESLGSYLLNFVVAFIIIKFIFFPTLGFFLNNNFPIVAIVSGSMEHKVVDNRVCSYYINDISSKSLNFDEWWGFCGKYYEDNFNLNKNNFTNFDYNNGLNIGDVMILYGKNPKNIEIGDILVFVPQDKMSNGESYFFNNYGPVIHRVVDKEFKEGKFYFRTKGDHNADSTLGFESNIPEDDVIGVAIFRIPYIGYIKLFLNKILIFFTKLFN